MFFSFSFKNICIKHILYFCLCNSCIYSQFHKELFDGIKNNDNKETKSLLKNIDYNLVNESQESLLIYSVKCRNISILKILLKNKKIQVNYKDSLGKTALDYAIELEGINNDSALILQHMQYDMCTSLIHSGAKVTSAEYDIKLRSFLLKGKPKYDKTLLGFCVEKSPVFVSTTAAYKMGFLGPFVSVITDFLGSFVSYSIDRIAHYRRFKKYNHSFILS